MLKLQDTLPDFKVLATISSNNSEIDKNFKEISNTSYAGKWIILFFYPKDFTFVCPTEIAGFNDLFDDFNNLNAQILGASIDSEFVHLAWLKSNSLLKNLKFPLIADVKRDLSMALGVLNKDTGVANRATFIIDPKGIIKYIEVCDMNIGRNPNETLRVLKALQTGELTPCSWSPGEKTL